MKAPTEDESRGESHEGASDLGMSPSAMLELARSASEMVVDRIHRLPSDAAWRGASRADLEPLLREPAPEEGRPAL